tara:strand:+ start:4919 stop:5275 length:357 start_codon:yes stop_codon:yes gene_type:complete
MRELVYLVFNKKGEITEKKIKDVSTFDIKLFPEYKHYKKYDNYIILYNVIEKSENITVFYFTDDRYTSDVALIKISNNKINNLTYKMYTTKILKKNIEENEYHSDPNDYIDDKTPFTY